MSDAPGRYDFVSGDDAKTKTIRAFYAEYFAVLELTAELYLEMETIEPARSRLAGWRFVPGVHL